MENNETYEYYIKKYGDKTVKGIANISINPDRYIEINKTYKKIIFSNDKHGDYWHRLDGPAVIFGYGLSEWWINDKCVDEEIHQWAIDNNIDLDNLTDVDKAMIKIVWHDYGK